MSHYCKYHPVELALWHCPLCRIECCDSCSPDLPGEAKGTPHYCVVCGGEMRNLGTSHSATPFWQHLGEFVQYPFSPVGLGLLLLGGLVPLLAPEGLPTILACFLVLLLMVKYGYSALEYVASGILEPVTPQQVLDAKNNEIVINLGVLALVLVGAVGYVYLQPNLAFYGGLLAIVSVLIFPLMVITAAVDRNIASALKAESIKAALGALGLNYAVLIILLLGLFAGLESFVLLIADILPRSSLSQVLPQSGVLALAMIANGYLLMVALVASGYMLYQFQAPLNFTPTHGRQQGRKNRARSSDPASIQVDICLKEGLYPKAVGILRNESQKKGATLTAHERYHKLIWLLNDEEALKNHAAPYFKLLLESNRDTQALTLMRDYLSRNSAFRPEDPDVCFDMAQSFLGMKEYKMAVHMLNGLHKDAPHYARLPEAYLLAARVLQENLGLPQKALALVQFLEGRFKTHKTYPEIQAFKGQLMAIKS